MTQSSQAASGKATKLNRVERNAWTKRKIFDAAAKVVELGGRQLSPAMEAEGVGRWVALQDPQGADFLVLRM